MSQDRISLPISDALSNPKENIENSSKDKLKTGHWWLAGSEGSPLEPEDIYNNIAGIVSSIDAAQNSRLWNNDKFSLIYNNKSLVRFMRQAKTFNLQNIYPQNRITLNVVASCVDTIRAKVCKNKVKVQFLTDHAGYQDRVKAQNLTDYIFQIFHDSKLYQFAPQVFTDAAVFGVGVLGINNENDEIEYEHVLLDEIRMSEFDAIYGMPRTLYRKKFMSKEKLVYLYPQFAEQIKNAGKNSFDIAPTSTLEASDMVQVTYGWHLPVSSTVPGKMTVCLDNVTLVYQDYTKDYFPFEFLHWEGKPQIGFYSVSLVEKLAGIQYEINRLLRAIQNAMHLYSVSRILVENSSKIAVGGALGTNEPCTIVRYSGTKPEHFSPMQTLPADVFNHLWMLRDKAYDEAGVSQMNATATKTPGLDSGAAIREMNDIGSERFSNIGSCYEQWFVGIADKTVDMTKDLVQAKGNNFKAFVMRGGKAVKLKAKDFNLTDEYKIRIASFPINMLPSTPPAKTQYVQEMIAAGWVDQQTGMAALGFPDTGHIVDLDTAQLEYSEFVTDQMINQGVYVKPEQYMDLTSQSSVIRMATSKLVLMKINDPQNENLPLLERFILEAGQMALANQQGQAMQAGGGTPTGNAPPAETAALLPQNVKQ